MERLADRYELGDALGQGRSTVYRAVDTRLRRAVAIKRVQLLAGHEDEDHVRTRALREAQASARLNTPHVVAVYDVVEEAGAVWLVMELVDGPSLAQVVADEGPMPHRRAATVGLGVLAALDAAQLDRMIEVA
ncbi:MAG TPA: protein kinase, partial [Acidimicrobiales bacterium]